MTSTALSLIDSGSFEHMIRVAKCYADSQIIPVQFQRNVPNIVVAIEMASRIGASPLMVMQNMNVIHGRPSWSSQFMIAAINSSGRFTPLRYAVRDLGETEVEYTYWEGEKPNRTKKTGKVKIRNKGCIAWANEILPNGQHGERLESPEITIEMAVLEGWYTKSDSKWKTMPDLMLRYRTATIFGRMYAPEILMGIRPQDEEEDIPVVVTPVVEEPAKPTPADQPPAGGPTPTPRKSKGAAAAKAAAAETAPEQAPAPATPAPAATTETSGAATVTMAAAPESTTAPAETQPAAAQPAPAQPASDAPKPRRVEVEEVTERPTTSGSIVQLRVKGEYNGTAYWKGSLNDVAPGQIIDAIMEPRANPKDPKDIKMLIASFAAVA